MQSKYQSQIIEKCSASERITAKEAEELYSMPLTTLSGLATERKRKASGDKVFYIKNFHIEPTNICRYHCKFCSYRKNHGQAEAWDTPLEEIAQIAASYQGRGIQEVHIVGGVNPHHTIEYFCKVISTIKKELPAAAIKAYSAIEHIYMAQKAGLSFKDALSMLRDSGMATITGGGAEIFAPHIREQICADKPDGDSYLALHRAAHELGIDTNATMLYGHIETIADRIDHMQRLRDLQDETGGFNAFIPLKYRSKANGMSHLGEVSVVEDMRTLAIARLFLDNIPHIKAYHPMYGVKTTEMALLYGADDIDGTVEDTTKIYSMAGVKSDIMTEERLIETIENVGFIPTLRDTFYNDITTL